MPRRETDPASELRPTHGLVPPNHMDTEAVILSEMLVNPDNYDRVASIIGPDHFYSNANRLIYRCVKAIQERGEIPDVVSVARFAQEKKWLDQIGGTPYLVQIATQTPAAGALLEQHAHSVKTLWRRRSAIAHAQRVAAEGYGDVGDEQAWFEGVEKTFSEIAHDNDSSKIESVARIGARQMARLYEAKASGALVSGIPTGFRKLDFLLSGLHPGDLYIIAARPGMGKTALLGSILRNVARYDPEHPEDTLATLMFSLEQPREQIAMRTLCAEGRASFNRIRNNRLHQDDYDRLNDGLERLSHVPMYIDDQPAITLLEIRAKIRWLEKQLKTGAADVPATRLGAVGVDYMQLMEAELGIRRRGSREQEVSSFSRGLKQLAKDLGVPILALSQLNRKVEDRQDKHPNLSDLRESGAIEQDSDTIMFIYRENYYEPTVEDNKAEVIVAKQRNGPTATVKVAFEAEHMLFRDLNIDEDEELAQMVGAASVSAGGANISDDEVNEDGQF